MAVQGTNPGLAPVALHHHAQLTCTVQTLTLSGADLCPPPPRGIKFFKKSKGRWNHPVVQVQQAPGQWYCSNTQGLAPCAGCMLPPLFSSSRHWSLFIVTRQSFQSFCSQGDCLPVLRAGKHCPSFFLLIGFGSG